MKQFVLGLIFIFFSLIFLPNFVYADIGLDIGSEYTAIIKRVFDASGNPIIFKNIRGEDTDIYYNINLIDELKVPWVRTTNTGVIWSNVIIDFWQNCTEAEEAQFINEVIANGTPKEHKNVEIGNEPNIVEGGPYATGGRFDCPPEIFTEQLIRMYNALSPHVNKIAIAGLFSKDTPHAATPSNPKGFNMDPTKTGNDTSAYLKGVITRLQKEPGGLAAFPKLVVGLHIYIYENGVGANKANIETRYADFLNSIKADSAGLDVWVTEFGWRSDFTTGVLSEDNEKKQAEVLKISANWLKDKVPVAIWLSQLDFKQNGKFQRFGIYDREEERLRPSFFAFKELNNPPTGSCDTISITGSNISKGQCLANAPDCKISTCTTGGKTTTACVDGSTDPCAAATKAEEERKATEKETADKKLADDAARDRDTRIATAKTTAKLPNTYINNMIELPKGEEIETSYCILLAQSDCTPEFTKGDCELTTVLEKPQACMPKESKMSDEGMNLHILWQGGKPDIVASILRREAVTYCKTDILQCKADAITFCAGQILERLRNGISIDVDCIKTYVAGHAKKPIGRVQSDKDKRADIEKNCKEKPPGLLNETLYEPGVCIGNSERCLIYDQTETEYFNCRDAAKNAAIDKANAAARTMPATPPAGAGAGTGGPPLGGPPATTPSRPAEDFCATGSDDVCYTAYDPTCRSEADLVDCMTRNGYPPIRSTRPAAGTAVPPATLGTCKDVSANFCLETICKSLPSCSTVGGICRALLRCGDNILPSTIPDAAEYTEKCIAASTNYISLCKPLTPVVPPPGTGAGTGAGVGAAPAPIVPPAVPAAPTTPTTCGEFTDSAQQIICQSSFDACIEEGIEARSTCMYKAVRDALASQPAAAPAAGTGAGSGAGTGSGTGGTGGTSGTTGAGAGTSGTGGLVTRKTNAQCNTDFEQSNRGPNFYCEYGGCSLRVEVWSSGLGTCVTGQPLFDQIDQRCPEECRPEPGQAGAVPQVPQISPEELQRRNHENILRNTCQQSNSCYITASGECSPTSGDDDFNNCVTGFKNKTTFIEINEKISAYNAHCAVKFGPDNQNSENCVSKATRECSDYIIKPDFLACVEGSVGKPEGERLLYRVTLKCPGAKDYNEQENNGEKTVFQDGQSISQDFAFPDNVDQIACELKEYYSNISEADIQAGKGVELQTVVFTNRTAPVQGGKAEEPAGPVDQGLGHYSGQDCSENGQYTRECINPGSQDCTYKFWMCEDNKLVGEGSEQNCSDAPAGPNGCKAETGSGAVGEECTVVKDEDLGEGCFLRSYICGTEEKSEKIDVGGSNCSYGMLSREDGIGTCCDPNGSSQEDGCPSGESCTGSHGYCHSGFICEEKIPGADSRQPGTPAGPGGECVLVEQKDLGEGCFLNSDSCGNSEKISGGGTNCNNGILSREDGVSGCCDPTGSEDVDGCNPGQKCAGDNGECHSGLICIDE